MDIFEKSDWINGILNKSRDVFRAVFDNTSQETARWKVIEENLKPNMIKIKK